MSSGRQGGEELEDLLGRMARREREILDSVRGAATPLDERVDLLRDLASAPRKSSAPPLLRRLVPGLAAAGILGVLGWAFLRSFPSTVDERDAPGTSVLGARGVSAIRVDVEDGSWRTLRWTYDGPHSPNFDVRIWDPLDQDAVRALLHRRTSEPFLALDPDVVASWPQRVLVEIDLLSVDGRVLDAAQDLLSRSSD